MACKYNKIRKFNTDIHVLEVNPRESEILLVATDGNKLATVPNIQNDYMIANGYTRAAAINGGFFQSNGQSNGWEYTDYQFVNSIGWEDGVMDLLWQDHKLIIDDVNERRFNEKFKGLAQWGVSASYALVIDGAINLQGKDKFSHHTSYNPRTFIGQKADGTVLLMVCDGRNKNNSVGLTSTQQASVCLELGCKNAINLDGGGSSTFEYNGQIKNAPTDGSLRKVSNAIVVYEKKTDSEGTKVDKLIALDFGHGGSDPGASWNGLKEKDITLEVGLQVKKRLLDHGFKVTTLREDDSYVGDAGKRGSDLGKTKADYALSIHVNSGGGTGAEILVPCKESFGYVEKHMMDELKLLGGFRGVKSREYVGKWHSRAINTSNKFTNTVDATDYYGVLREAWKLGVSATIVELFFIDNALDCSNYKSKKDKYVEALVKSICLGFEVEYIEQITAPPVTNKPEEDETNKLCRVSVGAYQRETAEKIKQELIKLGYKDTWIQVVEK